MAEQSAGVPTANFTPLEPFVHQVGGHSTMMKFDDVSVCKPFVVREHRFYEDLPSEMKAFTPEYRGVVYVSFEEDDEGFIYTIAHPDKRALENQAVNSSRNNSSDSDSSEDNDIGTNTSPSRRRSFRASHIESVQKRPHRVRLRSGKIELVDTRKDRVFAADEMTEQTQSEVNPWSLHLHKQQLSKLNKTAKIQKFIVLENVAYQFTYPCILDLKMGTRQHGDDTPNDKRAKIMAKVESSTSKTLGVRACGQQVYQQDSGRFICKNKYYGLKLSEEGFKRELTTFLHNGQRLRIELIEPFIHKLRKLYRVIEKLNSYRFFSSSLLLLYEGKELESGHWMRQDSECNSSMDSSDGLMPRNSSSASLKGSRRAKVEVRMIDFAHTSYSGCPQDKVRSGPDTGYLFGIENVIRLLEEIHKNAITEEEQECIDDSIFNELHQ
ncbi:inositol hexakisphosphate kinase 1 [Exaiptasia diaphana]|uniref:Kinase n=1 Tax=Exaiptasia diaphana TaxID=2652724 RepID=A0A913XRL9_EXADI|nr:inositol hexakisphosphate kinase 1 [Exaiptasia diaphana]XP_020908617.1 inositol hexakisphosphate kinase 1 [Exaiptasia diaphana]KXJ09715.1 Inositol hexakisphosphate kinase 1 [Exaiptasia diaphana]